MKQRIWVSGAICTIVSLAVLAAIGAPRASSKPPAAAAPIPAGPIKILFLGDNGHHKPADRFKQLEPALKERGIELTYTEKMEDINPENLAKYEGLAIYANTTQITPDQEKAMIDYIQAGHGFIPIHCASYCFLNSPKYIALVGAQFKTHKTGTFNTTIVNASHPIMQGFKPFETWDETYVHTKIAKDIELLQTRAEGDRPEPWTWTRNEGAGRVFYTAYGHDERTFSNPGFIDLIDRGIRWAVQRDTGALAAAAFENPKMTPLDPAAKPFEYITADGIPFYDPTGKGPKAGGGKWNQMQKPLDPAESIKHMSVPEGFEVKLFAAEPNIVKPICMNWDERGRLWVVESVDYPNRVTEAGKGNDRIKICEDTDGDGLADKFTIFAEGLNIPTSITFANGGVIVHERKSTWFLKDTDGDGKADIKKELFTGWYKGLDTHAGPNNLQYGLDNWIWGMLGYAGFEGSVGGKDHSFRQGFYRFKPDGSQLEFIRSTNNNTWGIGFSEEGLVFGSTANGNPSNFMPIPNRYYESVRGWAPRVLDTIANTYKYRAITDKVRQVDWHGGYTAAAGHALYTARAYPRPYWNRTAFVSEPTAHLLGTFILEPSGAAFKSHNPFNLLASDDEWTAPTMAEVGPDGAIWMVDWYAYIIQHNPTPVGYKTGMGAAYETPRRDHEHGRVYRIVYKDAKPYTPIDLSKATPDQLVATLKNDNLFWRKQAQRLLVERGQKDVTKALIELVKDTSVDEIGLNDPAIHALWTLHGLKALDGTDADALAAATAALKHPSAGVRRNALQVLPATEQSLAAVLDSKLIEDANPQVRLATLLAIADLPTGTAQEDRAASTVLAALQKPENASDKWIPEAAVSAGAKHDAAFLKSVLTWSKSRNLAPALGTPTAPEPEKPANPSAPSTANLIKNSSAETVAGALAEGWHTVMYGGPATHTVDDSTAHDGKKSLKIESTNGSDASWSQEITVKPNTKYRLSAWIKTQNIKPGMAKGALLNVHQLQQAAGGLTKPLTGDNDWTLVMTEFSTGGLKKVTINCLFGGWGRATGTAWYDDVQVIELGPASSASPLVGVDDGSDKVIAIAKLVTRHYAERAPVDSIIATLASLSGAERNLAAAVLDGLVAGWPTGQSPKLSDADRAQVGALAKSLAANDRDRLLVLFKRWGDKALLGGQMEDAIKTVGAQLADEKHATADRLDAARRLIRLDDGIPSINLLLAQVTPQASGELVAGVIAAIGDSRADEAAAAMLARWGEITPAARRACVAVMMRRGPWTLAMLGAIEGKKLRRDDLTASDWQILKLAKDKAIVELAKKLDTVQMDPDRQKALVKILPALDKPGDAVVGAKVFTTLCVQCHAINGAGGTVGPQLDGIGARDPKEILSDIVDPNRSVDANYRMWTVETRDDDSISGRLDIETQTSVELLDATGQRHAIQRKDIKSMSASQLSIMPVGLVDTLKPEEVSSLMAYLVKSVHGPAEPKK